MRDGQDQRQPHEGEILNGTSFSWGPWQPGKSGLGTSGKGGQSIEEVTSGEVHPDHNLLSKWKD